MLTYPHPDPAIFELGPLAVRWYGLMYLIGFAGGWWLGKIRARRPGSGWQSAEIDDLLFYIAMGVVLGGRIGYTLFYGFDDWLADPTRLFRIWEGGMSFHGGFLGVVFALWLFARKYGKNFFEVGDFIAPFTTIGIFAGRIGNFINGELWGAPSSVPWAMQVNCQQLGHGYDLCVNKLGLAPGTEWTPPLHPSQLYEATLEGLVLFLILWFYSNKPRPTLAVSGMFLLWYGIFRFAVEFVRMPDSHLGYLEFDWLTMGQLLSLPMILAGAGLIGFAYWRAGRRT